MKSQIFGNPGEKDVFIELRKRPVYDWVLKLSSIKFALGINSAGNYSDVLKFEKSLRCARLLWCEKVVMSKLLVLDKKV